MSNRIVNMDNSLDNMNVGYRNIESNVKFLLEVNNMTKWRLWPDKTYIHWGSISSPPTFILSGEKGAISGHNMEGDYDGPYATGATGVVSWKIGDTDKKLAIMYTLPYQFEKLKNKLSIAIVDENQKINQKFCKRMITDTKLATPKVFYEEIIPIEVKSDKFHVIGTMGTSHRCEIKIVFMPAEEQNYCPQYLGIGSQKSVHTFLIPLIGGIHDFTYFFPIVVFKIGLTNTYLFGVKEEV